VGRNKQPCGRLPSGAKEKKVKKRRTVLALVIAAIVILATTATAVLAAGLSPTTSTISINIVGPEKELTIQNPFDVKCGAISLSIPADGKIYAGDKIASVPVMVRNVGRMPYRINVSAKPAKTPAGNIQPSFDLRINSKGTTYYPWNMLVIAPGETKELTVEIYVSYGSSLVSFQGLILDIWPGPGEIPATEKG